MSAKPKIIIVDYALGNLFSVLQACKVTGIEAKVSKSKSDLISADAVILPGVGAFAEAMQNLHQFDLAEELKKFAASGKPLMGICLGMQLLLDESEEFGKTEGLGIIPGSVKKFPLQKINGEVLKVPQIAWNQIRKPAGRTWDSTPLENVSENEFMYFVHSYYTAPKRKEDVLSETQYGDTIYCSSMYRENIFAAQFHPEKSSDEGLRIYSNWYASVLNLKQV